MKRTLVVSLLTLALVSTAATTWMLAQNKFGTPQTIVHVSLIKWKAGVSDADKMKALNGVKDMAAKIPGIKNVWIKAVRIQPQGFNDAFVIEFEDKAAADRYAKDPVHDEWTKFFLSIREESISPQITNQ